MNRQTTWNVGLALLIIGLGGFILTYPKLNEQTAKAPEVSTCIVPAGYYGEIREIKSAGTIEYTCNVFKDKTNELVKVFHYGVPLDKYQGRVVQIEQQK